MAERAGVAVDYDNPVEFGGTRLYPVTPDRISLGRAVGRDVRGYAFEGAGIGMNVYLS